MSLSRTDLQIPSATCFDERLSDPWGPPAISDGMSNLALRDPLRQFFLELSFPDVVSVAEFEAGLEHIEVELQRVALDAHVAHTRGTRLADAVLDFEGYPYLARYHAAFDDILTMSLPPELAGWFSLFLGTPEPPSFEAIRRALVTAAADARNPHRQALARVALFEGVRLHLVLMAHWHPEETFGVGLELKDLSEIAEEQVMQWLAEDPAVPEDTRPLHIMVAAALARLTERSTEMRTLLQSMKRDFAEPLALRARIEATLADMDVVDALVIRNAVAPALDEQSLTVEHLQKRHFLALGRLSRSALDQRLRRAKQKMAAKLRRRRVALLDLLRQLHEATPAGSRGNR
jgi:hypothetical protein